ncbi:uncharacterized protein B0I36DRAFT_41769 [Microdochium trichocladiopsis]|uniref:Uncharacterized protein n=1 Tax=Microdochium trichocladiopsis TaxID=1682393 RepID=A0A9P8XT51_9PEZI|nr:uncharacterized protein B0I36DRAFT_41769 [Microdochium trichocladiopsis]KAH7016053.1 hypothetical protein B0I36DRAFT_41769 [Microdochium trichocladiopsis]
MPTRERLTPPVGLARGARVMLILTRVHSRPHCLFSISPGNDSGSLSQARQLGAIGYPRQLMPVSQQSQRQGGTLYPISASSARSVLNSSGLMRSLHSRGSVMRPTKFHHGQNSRGSQSPRSDKSGAAGKSRSPTSAGRFPTSRCGGLEGIAQREFEAQKVVSQGVSKGATMCRGREQVGSREVLRRSQRVSGVLHID